MCIYSLLNERWVQSQLQKWRTIALAMTKISISKAAAVIAMTTEKLYQMHCTTSCFALSNIGFVALNRETNWRDFSGVQGGLRRFSLVFHLLFSYREIKAIHPVSLEINNLLPFSALLPLWPRLRFNFLSELVFCCANTRSAHFFLFH